MEFNRIAQSQRVSKGLNSPEENKNPQTVPMTPQPNINFLPQEQDSSNDPDISQSSLAGASPFQSVDIALRNTDNFPLTRISKERTETFISPMPDRRPKNRNSDAGSCSGYSMIDQDNKSAMGSHHSVK